MVQEQYQSEHRRSVSSFYAEEENRLGGAGGGESDRRRRDAMPREITATIEESKIEVDESQVNSSAVVESRPASQLDPEVIEENQSQRPIVTQKMKVSAYLSAQEAQRKQMLQK